MTIASSVPAVINAVLATITTALAGQVASSGQPVSVFDGELGTFVADEFLCIQGVSGGRQSWATIGKTRRTESYDIDGLVRVYIGNDDQAYCRTRAYALLAFVETALDNDPSVGGVVNGSVQISPVALRMGVTDVGGRAAELEFTLAVVTQLIAT